MGSAAAAYAASETLGAAEGAERSQQVFTAPTTGPSHGPCPALPPQPRTALIRGGLESMSLRDALRGWAGGADKSGELLAAQAERQGSRSAEDVMRLLDVSADDGAAAAPEPAARRAGGTGAAWASGTIPAGARRRRRRSSWL